MSNRSLFALLVAIILFTVSNAQSCDANLLSEECGSSQNRQPCCQRGGINCHWLDQTCKPLSIQCGGVATTGNTPILVIDGILLYSPLIFQFNLTFESTVTFHGCNAVGNSFDTIINTDLTLLNDTQNNTVRECNLTRHLQIGIYHIRLNVNTSNIGPNQADEDTFPFKIDAICLTNQPTNQPTKQPTKQPTSSPTAITSGPTANTRSPTNNPTATTPLTTNTGSIKCDDVVTGDYKNETIVFEFNLLSQADVTFIVCNSTDKLTVTLQDINQTKLAQCNQTNECCNDGLTVTLSPGNYLYKLSFVGIFGTYNIETVCINLEPIVPFPWIYVIISIAGCCLLIICFIVIIKRRETKYHAVCTENIALEDVNRTSTIYTDQDDDDDDDQQIEQELQHFMDEPVNIQEC